jgi:hypothetical protein
MTQGASDFTTPCVKTAQGCVASIIFLSSIFLDYTTSLNPANHFSGSEIGVSQRDDSLGTVPMLGAG